MKIVSDKIDKKSLSGSNILVCTNPDDLYTLDSIIVEERLCRGCDHQAIPGRRKNTAKNSHQAGSQGGNRRISILKMEYKYKG